MAINISLRDEVESKVIVFEQYLKVAMLQTEAGHFQKQEQERHQTSSSRMQSA
jgi:hypothetical protein